MIKGNIFKVTIIFFSILILAFLLLSLKNIQDIRKNAANNNSLEAESASLVGNVSLGQDPAASKGSFIEFGSSPNSISPVPTSPNPSVKIIPTTPVNTSFQPTAPYYSTFFYLWYQNPNTDSKWSYWTDHSGNPPKTWFSHYLPDPFPNSFDPSTELYSSNNYNIFKWQASKMSEAKIEVAIASWWGQGTKEDSALTNIITNFMPKSDNPYPHLRWAIYYENEGFSDPSVSQIVSDLNYLKSKYAQSPYLLKIDNKPVVFVYAGTNDSPGSMTERWKDAANQLSNSVYIVLKVFSGYAKDPNQPNSWHQYSPAVRSSFQGNYSYSVSPGFWLDDGSGERLVRNSSDFESAVKSMVAANTTWKLITTWNELGEGSGVEPAEEIEEKNSATQLKPNGYPFKNLYVDILNRNLPNLE